MPTMSKTPMTASSEAAAVMGMPWSWAGGHEVRLDQAVRRGAADREGAREQPERSGAGGVEQDASRRAPGRAPRQAPASARTPRAVRRQAHVGRVVAQQQPDEGDDGERGAGRRSPRPGASRAARRSRSSSGRKTSWPEAPAAVRMPVTRPRRATNQRLVTVAAKASAIEPVPRPTSRPQHSISCQAAVIQTVRPAPDRDRGQGARRPPGGCRTGPSARRRTARSARTARG